MKLPAWHSAGNREAAWKASMSGLGKRLLEGMGWKEGKTLGSSAASSGLVKCIEADAAYVDFEKRVKGVGANRGEFSTLWWEDAFNEAASQVKADKKKLKKEKKKKKDAAEDSSSDEPQKKKKKKKKKSRSKERSKRNRDGSLTTATVDELEIVARLSKDKWGFSGGREGKMERIRRQEEMYAARNQPDAESSGRDAKRSKSTSSTSKVEVPQSAADASDSEKEENEMAEIRCRQAYSVKWWGSKIFTYGGILAGIKKQRRSLPGLLSEKEQEKAFFKAKDNAVHDHSGIGSSTLDIKLGEDFKGHKTVFNDSDDKTNSNEVNKNVNWRKLIKQKLKGKTSMHIEALKKDVMASVNKTLKLQGVTLPSQVELEAKFYKKLAKCKEAVRSNDQIHYRKGSIQA